MVACRLSRDFVDRPDEKVPMPRGDPAVSGTRKQATKKQLLPRDAACVEDPPGLQLIPARIFVVVPNSFHDARIVTSMRPICISTFCDQQVGAPGVDFDELFDIIRRWALDVCFQTAV